MQHKEFVRLMESNLVLLDRLADQLRRHPSQLLGYPRQQVTVLVRLHMGGPACLKDIARREHITTPNLCATFRKLEASGLVQRTVDDNDRRNTWYSVTDAGAQIAKEAMDKFRAEVESLFRGLSTDDERELTAALKTMNTIFAKLEKMEKKNA